uniref:Uncharacterized protein n=1 Tax=uncultured Desulfobacterium sp. TaxID=201089 RepID=E1YDS3_9BACT|nr:unknown protein [uncultured Desulfobacterium sp.]
MAAVILLNKGKTTICFKPYRTIEQGKGRTLETGKRLKGLKGTEHLWQGSLYGRNFNSYEF